MKKLNSNQLKTIVGGDCSTTSTAWALLGLGGYTDLVACLGTQAGKKIHKYLLSLTDQ